MLNDQDKLRLVKKIRLEMRRWFDNQSGEKGNMGAYCLWWAYHTCKVLKANGIDAQLQAGSAYWPRLTEGQDDGKPTTFPQFGYEFTPGVKNLLTVAGGTLPEMHVWAAIASSETIIDVTTRYWPEQAQRISNFTWPGTIPPDFFWGTVTELPAGAVYVPNVEAIRLCYMILQADRNGYMSFTLVNP